MTRYILITVISLLMCGNAFAEKPNGYNNTTDPRKIAWMDKGKSAIKLKLKDPSSAKFRNIYFQDSFQNIPMTCGEVNSKNSLGAYTGFQKFLSSGTPELSALENEVSDFSNLWNTICK